MNFTINDLIEALKPITYKANSNIYSGICINSKNCFVNSIFFAFKGKKTDGHNHIKEAFKNGASLVVSEKTVDYPFLMVENSKDALLDLLSYYLKKLNLQKIAITGSVGKTTTRFFLSRLLDKFAATTIKNYNTEVSIPLILNNITRETRYLIFELGLQKVGDIKLLSSKISPNISIITKVANVHMEYFKTFEDIIREKLSLLNFTSDFAVVDFKLKDYIQFPNTYFVDYERRYLKPYISFRYKYNGEDKKIEFKNIPNFFTPNLISALKVCEKLKIPFESLNLKIELPNTRFEIKDLEGFIIIADYYNSNPYSLKKSLEYLKTFKNRRKVIVLGDMLELGKDSIYEHKKLATMLKKFDLIILYGELMKYANDGYNYFSNKNKAITFLKSNLKKGDLVFIKGSRSMKMEDFEEAIKCK